MRAQNQCLVPRTHGSCAVPGRRVGRDLSLRVAEKRRNDSTNAHNIKPIPSLLLGPLTASLVVLFVQSVRRELFERRSADGLLPPTKDERTKTSYLTYPTPKFRSHYYNTTTTLLQHYYNITTTLLYTGRASRLVHHNLDRERSQPARRRLERLGA